MTWPPDKGPLPRSLVPLESESLFGLLLRLAYRLDESPLRVARRTGAIRPPGSRGTYAAATKLLLRLDPPQLQTFARSTRITTEQAENLTLLPLSILYPPLADALTRRARPPWLRFDSTRYCPACLAGNGSPIQNRYGGAWRLHWHLPFVFACLEHHTYLRDSCPACVVPPMRLTPGSGAIIPAQGTVGLHPAQCRAATPLAEKRICGARLDKPHDYPAQPFPDLTPDIAAIQQELLDLLQSPDPAHARTRFTDLSVLTTVIAAAWPRHPHLPGREELLDAFHAHHDKDLMLTEGREPQI
ncbi:TniQ family protein, partial [Streptomyces sp. NPDC059956]